MILSFLAMEYAPGRSHAQIAEALSARQAGPELIERGDLSDRAENALRRAIWGDFRCCGRNELLFERLSADVRWEWAYLDGDDLGRIRYADCSYWNALSGGTGSPLRTAEPIRTGKTACGVPNDSFYEALAHVRRGGGFPPLIALTDERASVFDLLDGHRRVTAYALAPDLFRNVRALIGHCDAGSGTAIEGERVESRVDNPWKHIDLEEYESHMRLDSVGQLQAIGRMTAGQLARYPVKTAAILGVAGGNGLEHANAEKFSAVYGIDVNPAYLAACARRFPHLAGRLHLIEADAGDPAADLPRAELVIANLFVEYIGCAAFARAVERMGAKYVCCGIQLDEGASFVSDSPYAHIFDGLSEIHAPVGEAALCDWLREAGYELILRKAEPLPNGKALLRLDFRKAG